MDQTEESGLAAGAADYARRGSLLELQGKPDQAERLYLQALKQYEQLSAGTGKPEFSAALREICLSLADLCMQQGNMHGADVYYVKAGALTQEKEKGKDD